MLLEKKKIIVLGSGSGSNFEAIVKYFTSSGLDIVCASDKADAFILTRASNLNILAFHLPFGGLEKHFSENAYDLCVLAGFMRILPTDVLGKCRFVNIHPSLLPSFKGMNAIQQAFDAGVKITGVTVHWVSEELDGGKIIAQLPVAVEPDDNIFDLEAKIHETEHKLYPPVIESILKDQIFSFSDLAESPGCGKVCGKSCR